MKNIYSHLLGLLLLGSASANASTVLSPTDGDVNFINFETPGTEFSFELYLFDDSVTINPMLNPSDGLFVVRPSIVGIAGPVGSNYIATNSLANTLTLTGSDHFIVAMYDVFSNAWIEDSGYTDLGANAIRMTFGGTEGGFSGVIVDVQAASPVPLPTAIWLFASGLVALTGISRRRKLVIG